MKTQGSRSREIIVDRAWNPHWLDAKSFIERPRPTKPSVPTNDHQSPIFHIGTQMPHGGLLHLLVLEIFEATAPNWTAWIATHAAGIILGHRFDPVVGQT